MRVWWGQVSVADIAVEERWVENAETLRQLIDMATSMCQSATAKVWHQSRKDELAWSVTCQIASETASGRHPSS